MSARIKDQLARRVLDSAARQRRARKALESLEQDNSHEDPHADLVMSKKALSLFQVPQKWSTVSTGNQCCGTVTIYYGSGSGSGSDF